MNRQFNDAKDLIVLVHGFGAIRWMMRPLAYQLRSRGFRVKHWNYVSLFDPIERHAIRFFDFLRTVAATGHRFHIVAHSMGSIVSLSALNRGVLPNMGRLVLLAPQILVPLLRASHPKLLVGSLFQQANYRMQITVT